MDTECATVCLTDNQTGSSYADEPKDELTDSSAILYEPLPRPVKKIEPVSPCKGEGKNSASGNSTREDARRGGHVDGALLCLSMRKAGRLKHLSTIDAAKKLAVCMHEPKYNLIKNTIKQIGLDMTIQLFREASQIQEEGGLTSGDGNYKKSPGGVFFHLLKKFASPEQLKIIFERDNKKKKLHAQKRKNKLRKERAMDTGKLDGGLSTKHKSGSRLGPLPTAVDMEDKEVESEREEGEVKEEGEVREEDRIMEVDSVEASVLAATQMFDRTDSVGFSDLFTLD